MCPEGSWGPTPVPVSLSLLHPDGSWREIPVHETQQAAAQPTRIGKPRVQSRETPMTEEEL